MWLVGLIAAVAALAAAPTALLARRWRWRWQEVVIGEVPPLGGGPYRAAAPGAQHLRRAPGMVVLAAWSGLFAASLAALLTVMLFTVYGWITAPLVFLPSIAIMLVPFALNRLRVRAALTLLRRDPRDAYLEPQRATRWLLPTDGAFGLLALVCARWIGPLGWCALAYAMLSLAQAGLLLWTIERHKDWLFAPTRRVRVGAVWQDLGPS